METDIEVSPHNNMLLYKKGYTASFVKGIIEKRKLDGLRIFDHLDGLDSINFLEDYGFLEKLNVFCIYDQDYSFLKKLTKLKQLMIGASVKENNTIDLSNQQNIENLNIKWRKGKIIGLEKCQNLKSLSLQDFKENDFFAISQLQNLRELDVRTSSIKTVNGLHHFLFLEKLLLADCKSLKTLEDLTELKSLVSLNIELCTKIEDYSFIGRLINLKTLELVDCKGINSIKFVQNLKKLEQLALLGNIVVLDGDMIPAKSINKVFYPHRKHYNFKIENKEYEQLIESNLKKIITGFFNEKK